MKTLEEKIEIMQAALAGAEIQYNTLTDNWADIDNPSWDWDGQDYRVKPENKQVPYDFKDIPNLVLHTFIHNNVQHTEEVCIRASEIGVGPRTEDVRYVTLATYYEYWHHTLDRWESCTKTVKE